MLRGLIVLMMSTLIAAPIAASYPECPEGRRLLVMVDQSGSMTRDFDREGLRWRFVRALLEELRGTPGRVSIFAFGTRVVAVLEDAHLADAQVPEDLPDLGGTDLVAALQEVTSRPDADCSAAVLVTDGVPQIGRGDDPRDHLIELKKAILEADRRGIPVVMVLIAPPSIERWPHFQTMREFWRTEAEASPALWLLEIRDAVGSAAAARTAARELATRIASPTPTPMPTSTPTPASAPPPGEVVKPAPSPPERRSAWDLWMVWGMVLLALVGGILGGILIRRRRRPRLVGELVWRTPEGFTRRQDLSRYRGSVDLGKAVVQPTLKGMARLELRRDPEDPRSRVLYLVPLREGRVRHRGVAIGEPVRLTHGDEIDLDGFPVRFEDIREQIRRLTWRMR